MHFFWQDEQSSTADIAQKLLGYTLVHQSPAGTTAGLIVETEAYLGVRDAACHSYGGKATPRLEAMYGPPGHFYIYQMRGLRLLNVITQPAGDPQGVLIRAIEPIAGLDLMAARRPGQSGANLTNGPGKMTQAMGIEMSAYGTSITVPPLFIDFSQQRQPAVVAASPRIGIPNKGHWTTAPLRFTVAGNPFVSQFKGPADAHHGWRVD